MLTFNTIVVAVDFSATSYAALEFAAEMARDMPGCHLHILHVAAEPVCDAWMVNAPRVDETGLRRPWLDRTRHELEVMAAALHLPASQLTCAAIVGSPHVEIPRYAREHHANLVIVGSHGHGPITRFFLGSVARHVLRHAPCGVLVVPHASRPALTGRPAPWRESQPHRFDRQC